MKLCLSFVCARALVPLGRCFTETTSAAIARDSRRPSTQARHARVRMGLVHPANPFPGAGPRAGARTPDFDAYRPPPRGRPRAPRATENELAHVGYFSPEE